MSQRLQKDLARRPRRPPPGYQHDVPWKEGILIDPFAYIYIVAVQLLDIVPRETQRVSSAHPSRSKSWFRFKRMESLIESSTYRTLHAHNFSRTSSQAAFVLSDLLSRYLFLLTSSCSKYAQHSGRMNLTVQDALSALEEMGIDLDELSDYCRTEGRELGRYTIQTMRRMEDLKDIRGQPPARS